MLVLRLQRTGRENLPAYRIVLAEKSAPVKGHFKEIIGHYIPNREPVVLKFEEDRISHWISKGAIPSNTLARLLKKNGVKNMDKYIQTYTKKMTKDPEVLAKIEAEKKAAEEAKKAAAAPKVEEAVAPEAPAADATAETPVEAPKEETPAPEAAPAPEASPEAAKEGDNEQKDA